MDRRVGTVLGVVLAVLCVAGARTADAQTGATEPAPTPSGAAEPAPAPSDVPEPAAPAPTASAAPPPVAEELEYVRRGWYGGIGLIYAPGAFKLDHAEGQLPPSRTAGTSLDSNNTFGLDVRAGYRLRPRFAVEGNYQFLPGFQVDRGGAGTLVDLTAHALSLNGKYFLLEDTFQPYLLGGVGFLHANADATIAGFSGDGTGFAGRVGAGADVYLRPDLVVDVEFSVVLPTGPVADVRYLPLVFGVGYRF